MSNLKGYCYCKDDPGTEVDVRPPIYRNILDLCPRNELEMCLCKDGESNARAPFNLTEINSCRPKRVRGDLWDDRAPRGLFFVDTFVKCSAG